MSRHGAGSPLDESVLDLMHSARSRYGRDDRVAAALDRLLRQFEEPVRIAVVGPSGGGKSTLINGLIGEQVAPLVLDDSDDVVTWYADGPQPHVTAWTAAGDPQDLAVTRSARGMRIDPQAVRQSRITDVTVAWPTRSLRHATLADTPGVVTTDEDHTSAAIEVLHEADAVLYVSREIDAADLRILQSAQEGMVAAAAPVNTIMVLSHADEVGGGRIDALLTARQLARRQHRDPSTAALCQGVVAYGGLIALAGRTLSDADFTAIVTVAAAPRAAQNASLMSADRFSSEDCPVPLTTVVRRELLDRLGIHGVRLATTLVRAGNDTRAELCAELVRRSGLTELREAVNSCFLDRRPVLKARTALSGLERLTRQLPDRDGAKLSARVEQLLATAHDFRELRLLATLRSGQVAFAGEVGTEAHRLLGGNGTDMAVRLGVDYPATDAEVWELCTDALHRWQQQAEDPRLTLHQRRAAGVVVRSCEGLLAQLRRS